MSFGHKMRGNAPQGMQSRREIAQTGGAKPECYAAAPTTCHRQIADGCSSKRKSAHCQHRYPSPCRSVLSQSRPANPFWRQAYLSAAKRYAVRFMLDAGGKCVDSAVVNKINKGSIPCLTQNSLSLRRPHLRLAPVRASTPMVSARLSALASAAWPVKRSAAIAPRARLSAQSAAHWPTTSKTLGSRNSDQARGDFRLIHTPNRIRACAGPATRRVSALLKHHQGAHLCATSSNHFPFSPFLASPLVLAPLRRQHPSWPQQASPHRQWKQRPSLSPLFAMQAATALPRAAKTARVRATDITTCRRRGLPPAAVLRSKDQPHV